jgi:hypothetical protein
MSRTPYESDRVVEAMEALWSPRRGASRMDVETGTGGSLLTVTPLAEAPASPMASEHTEDATKVR